MVTVTRTSEKDVKHRQIIVSIDGKPFATLMFGQTATIDLPAGHHSIKAYNTLVWKTLEFDLKEGQDASFSVVNTAGNWSLALLAFIGAGPLYVQLEQTS